MQKQVIAGDNLNTLADMFVKARKGKEPFCFCSVYIGLSADTLDKLQDLQAEIIAEMTRSRIHIDKLHTAQREGFISLNPSGYNAFGNQFERVLPATSISNLNPFSYSGITDNKGFYIGKDKNGTYVLKDFTKRTKDIPNSNILILGNSGQGKTVLIRNLSSILRMSGKRIVCIDAENEQKQFTEDMQGVFMNLMDGRFIINPLELRQFSNSQKDNEEEKPNYNYLISYCKNFFKVYKPKLEHYHIDVLEIMLNKLFGKFGIDESTDFSKLKPIDYPILSDLHDLLNAEFKSYELQEYPIYKADTLQELNLSLRSICVGNDSKYFNGHTNVLSDKFITFGVKEALDTNEELKNVMLFNALSYMADATLTAGNTIAVIDELHVFLSNPVALDYIRNNIKRNRKRNSGMIIASQNLEDYTLPSIADYTKPLFAIPSHSFLFNAGSISSKFYIDQLQLEQSEYDIIKQCGTGTCLFRSGSERYHLEIDIPDFKKDLLYSKAAYN